MFKPPAQIFQISRAKISNFAPKFLNFPPNFSNFPRQNFKFRAKIQKIRGQRQRFNQIPVRRANERMRNVAPGGRPPHRIREHPVRSERRAGHGSVGHGPADQLLVAEPADQECALQSVFRQRGGCGGCPGGWWWRHLLDERSDRPESVRPPGGRHRADRWPDDRGHLRPRWRFRIRRIRPELLRLWQRRH